MQRWNEALNSKEERAYCPKEKIFDLDLTWMKACLWWDLAPSGQRNTSMHSYNSRMVYLSKKRTLGKCETRDWRAGGNRPWNLQSTLNIGNTSLHLTGSMVGTLRDLGSGKNHSGDVEVQLALKIKRVSWATNCVLRFWEVNTTGLGPVLFTGLTQGYKGARSLWTHLLPTQYPSLHLRDSKDISPFQMEWMLQCKGNKCQAPPPSTHSCFPLPREKRLRTAPFLSTVNN